MNFISLAACLAGGLGAGAILNAQSIAPTISEYKGAAKGRFDVTNNTLTAVRIVLEPKSFSVTPEGQGIFRPLDSRIRLKLSDMSFHLDPQQTHYVFYSATADQLPAWFSVYATFAPIAKTPGINVHIQLPHTVYLYPKKVSIRESDIELDDVHFKTSSNLVALNIKNIGGQLGRAQEVIITSGSKKASSGGFPLLPSGSRTLTLDWKEAQPPEFVQIRFPNFTVKRPILERNQ